MKRNLRKLIGLTAVSALAVGLVAGCSEDDDGNPVATGEDLIDGMVVIRDDNIQPGASVTLSADTTYLLDGFVFVEEGATLNIPAGTVIKGNYGGGLNASALIIARGGKIMANGTADNPIIFTARADDVTRTDDINDDTRGLWGGLIVLGKSRTQVDGGSEQIEGIHPDDNRGQYGGSDLEDNSGTIRYVSIRYGGTNIGEGNEINGLTLGAVGSGTTIEYVEVYNNSDDGFEWFGGTVNTKYLIAVGCLDDSYDWDEGFRGKGQYWVVVQSEDGGDRGAEMDGCAGSKRGDTEHYSKPTIFNATFIGSGAESGNLGNMAFKFREETGGFYYNSIFTDFYGDVKLSDGTLSLVGVINFDNEKGSQGNLVTDHIQSGDLKLENNIFCCFSNGASTPEMLIKFSKVDDASVKESVVSTIGGANTFGTSPGVSRDNLLPTAGGAAFTNTKTAPMDSFFDATNYVGAFGTVDWTAGWTYYSEIK